MIKVLIVGANSFIGTSFQELSQFKGSREVSLITYQPEDIDFTDVDVVLHLAAIVHNPKNIADKDYFYVNRDLCVMTAKMAKAAGVNQFIFLSTIRVYGKYLQGYEAWNEDSLCLPEDLYGKSKYEAELSLRKLEDIGFTISIIRTPMVYGKGVAANMLRMIRLIEKFPVLPFRKVNNNRHYTYVENLIGYIDRIIEVKASGTFIVKDDEGISTELLVLYISKFLNRKTSLISLPGFIIKTGIYLIPNIFDRLYNSYYLDNTKTKEILNYTPLFSTEEGLKRMIIQYLQKYEDN
jgi:nucleoside-diphosphate-sugar epimerase